MDLLEDVVDFNVVTPEFDDAFDGFSVNAFEEDSTSGGGGINASPSQSRESPMMVSSPESESRPGRRKKSKKTLDTDFEPTSSEPEEIGESGDEYDQDVDERTSSSGGGGGGSKKRGSSTKKRAASRKKPSSSSSSEEMVIAADGVILSREALLHVSSEQYDKLVERIASTRSLSDAEMKEVRRQKRLIKNRESAALSRNRKKQQMDTLEAENTKLKQELLEERRKWSVAESVFGHTSQWRLMLDRISATSSGFGKSLAPMMMQTTMSQVGVMFVLLLSVGLFIQMPWFSMSGNGISSSSSSSCPQPDKDLANLRRLLSVESFQHAMEADVHQLLHVDCLGSLPVEIFKSNRTTCPPVQ